MSRDDEDGNGSGDDGEHGTGTDDDFGSDSGGGDWEGDDAGGDAGGGDWEGDDAGGDAGGDDWEGDDAGGDSGGGDWEGDDSSGRAGGAAGGGASDAGGVARDTPGPDEQYCSSCGSVIKKQAEICPECGVRQAPPGGTGPGGSSKDRTTAGILAILLGGLGAHKFYLEETGLGLLYLCFSWTLIPALVGLIEGILYLTKTDEEFQRQYVKN